MRISFLIPAFSIFFSFLCSAPTNARGEDERAEFFEKRIRPILANHCYECHGPDEAEAKLRLDSKAGWARGGNSGPAIVPGDPSASLLVRAVSYSDEQLKMPPDRDDRLTARQIADIATWIRRGAVDPRQGGFAPTELDKRAESHWAFQPLAPPQLNGMGNPIDTLIGRRLSAAGFVATARAEIASLIRRATYDLHGLPPTAAQRATTAAKFAELVDGLLDSPRYGERWGRHWLDVARYSDAKDGVLMYGDARIRPFAYTYRDYVIRSFNDDKPFDQFIREQIAADQLELPENSPALAGMGLLTLGRMFDRNPHDVIDDQIDVITRGFLGLTVTCARCHDHKFDPVPIADYYSLYGVFASSIQPYKRPRIEQVTPPGEAHEKELQQKLDEVFRQRDKHYERTLATARARTSDYLVQVATTEPDISETSIFFLSLLPEQLRPQITYRWRKLIARRGYAEDPVFGPWSDLLKDRKLRADEWRRRGVDPRVIAGLIEAAPQTPAEVATAYGRILRGVGDNERALRRQLSQTESSISSLKGGAINLADVVAGGNGFGGGERGGGIHPVTGKATSGETGFIDVAEHDRLVAVPDNPFVDGVFTPKSKLCVVSSTGLQIDDLTPTGGQTWDYFKFGPSSGFTVNTIDGVDYNTEPQTMVAMHANKGITFDLAALRASHEFADSRCKALLGNGGAKDQSQLNFAAYVDGKRVVDIRDLRAQQEGAAIDIALPEAARFLTLVVTEGKQGVSHDQAILGDPRIEPGQDPRTTAKRAAKLKSLEERRTELQQQLASHLESLRGDPLSELLNSPNGPVWFPVTDIYYYLSRKDKDAFRGLVNQLDSISVKHRDAAARAMVMVDAAKLYDPVVFQRGDPTQPGAPVPRRFLRVVAGNKRPVFAAGSGRLDLANAIASADNPLTARVWANRVWMHHFGEPLVESPSDFGLRTARPVHHELLDLLADVLIKSGWRTKPLHRLIMTSNAYQRGSLVESNDKFARQAVDDPRNGLIWRGNRRRLDLEQMRDTMLVVSGQLDTTMYGRPPLITDPSNRRRSVYAFVERQNLPNIVQTFDFANADTSTARRAATTVPQQALFALNSPFMLRAAERLAARLQGAAAADRVRQLYDYALGRQPTAEEVDLGVQYVDQNSWELYAQIILMTNELMFVD